MQMEHRIGPHRLVIEDDVALSYSDRAVTATEMQQLLDICASVRDRWSRLYVVTIMGAGFDMTPDARKLASEWGRKHELTLNVVVAASLTMRTLLGLIARAQAPGRKAGRDQVRGDGSRSAGHHRQAQGWPRARAVGDRRRTRRVFRLTRRRGQIRDQIRDQMRGSYAA